MMYNDILYLYNNNNIYRVTVIDHDIKCDAVTVAGRWTSDITDALQFRTGSRVFIILYYVDILYYIPINRSNVYLY